MNEKSGIETEWISESGKLYDLNWSKRYSYSYALDKVGFILTRAHTLHMIL